MSCSASVLKLQHTLSYDESALGKVVHYRIRWMYKDGTRGTWSQAVSAVIA